MKRIAVVYCKLSNRYSMDYVMSICRNLEKMKFKVECTSIEFFDFDKRYDLVVMTSWVDVYRKLLKIIRKNNPNIVFFGVGGGLDRDQKTGNSSVDDIQYLVGFNRYLYDGDFIYEDNLPPDRIKKFNIQLNPWRKDGKYVLIAHQHFNIYDKDRIGEFEKIVNKYKKQNCNIKIRLHPGIKNFDKKKLKKFGLSRDKSGKILYRGIVAHSGNNVSLNDDLKTARCLVTYDSSIVVNTIAYGVPIIIHGKHITGPVESPSIKDLRYPERQAWLNWLAFQNWNRKELCGPAWFSYYKRVGLLKI